jgi:valyl-tRNA synthetase
MMNLEGYTPSAVDADAFAIEDRWLLSRLATVTQGVTDALETYRFAEAARLLYDFAWDEFCSFYVEMTKGRLQDAESRPVAQRVLAQTLDTLLRLLHPMIPFITEEVWQLLGQVAPTRGLNGRDAASESVMMAAWPKADLSRQDPRIEAQFARFQGLLTALREIRSRQNIPPKTPINFAVRCNAATAELLQPMTSYFESMAGAQAIGWGSDVTPPAMTATLSLSGMDVYVDLTGHIDVAAEIARLEQELAKLPGMIAAKEKQLANENFVSRAKPEIVQGERDKLQELKDRLESTQAVIAELRKASRA